MKLGVDIFSLRFQDWDAFEHLEYAKEIGLDVVHFSDLAPFDSLDDAYLERVKARADELGLDIEAGMLSICPTATIFDAEAGTAVEQVEQMLHVADMLGSPILRCVQGSSADRLTEISFDEHIQNTIKVCRAVRDMCMDLGIKLAIENHSGDFHGHELAALIEEAGPEFVGACIDTGNPMWAGESPFVTLDHLAPYVAASHVRDTSVWAHPDGAGVQWVAMGDGNIGIKEWAERFKNEVSGVPFTLEIITGSPPRVLDYLAEDSQHWKTYKGQPAEEFAQFERLVRQGQPFMKAMLTAGWADQPEEYRAALAVQQRVDLERSVKYCKEVLGVGES